MVYTIRIRAKSSKARSIINLLKALQEDYDFIEISEDDEDKAMIEIMKELESRYNSFLMDKNGKDWKILLNEFNTL